MSSFKFLQRAGSGNQKVLSPLGINYVGRRGVLGCIALLGATYGLMRGQTTREDDLKAALVMSFARFTDWPASSLETPLTIGVLGDNELLEILGRMTAGKLIQGRAIQVRSPRSAAELRSFQMLYAGTVENKKLDEYLAAARQGAVLTVGESPRFLPSGGIVRLFQEDGRLSFEVNLSALAHAGLNISSKLLRLGYTIRDPVSVRQKP